MRRTVFAVAAVAAALGLGACGDSPEDEAYDDGEQIGQSVRSLHDADTKTDVEQAYKEIKVTVENMGEDARKRVKDQVETARDTLEDANGDVKGATQELRAQADAFRNGSNSVSNEFWRGFEDGYDDE